MTPGGIILMIASVGSVTALFAWCIAKVLRIPQETEHLHGGHESHTPDETKP